MKQSQRWCIIMRKMIHCIPIIQFSHFFPPKSISTFSQKSMSTGIDKSVSFSTDDSEGHNYQFKDAVLFLF